MSSSINQVLLIGNVGKDPESKPLDGGVKVATFSIATSTGGYKKHDGTEVPQKTQWHNIVAWRGLAELAEKYIRKGDRITVLGSISYREYEKDGVKRYITDIVAYDIVLSPAKSGDNTRPPITANDAPSPGDFPSAPQSDDLPF